MTAPVTTIVERLLVGRTAEELAARIGVSVPTIKRWSSGGVQPRPHQEGRLRALLLEDPATGTSDLDAAMYKTLGEVREALHRRGRIGSRGDAVDEISKLLFAHVFDIERGGAGLSALEGPQVATRLRAVVAEAYARRLPDDLAHELRPSDLELRLRDDEDELAAELARAFVHLTSSTVADALRDPVAADFLNGFFGTFLADSFADERSMGQYMTPTEVVDAMVTVGFALAGDVVEAWLESDPTTGGIMDPSCGVGSFLVTATRRLIGLKASSNGRVVPEEWLSGLVRDRLLGVDKSERMIRLAITNFSLLGAHAAPLHLANALAKTGRDGDLMSGFEGTASLILTNPPFGAEFSGESLAGYKLANGWAKTSTKHIDSELLFVERYLDWLAPDGVALVVVPDSILTNRGLYSDLREALASRATVEAVVSLPPTTFGAAGTSTKTSILGIRKGRRSGPRAYVALCREVGFDVETRASLRQKVRHDRNDLLRVQEEIVDEEPVFGRRIPSLADHARWDAWYHASLPPEVEKAVVQPRIGSIFVRDVADLVTERVNPSRWPGYFSYIEISDVDGERLLVSGKQVPTADAPSRARKPVKVGDVLVATVRPERRAIGVVTEADDGAVCSTGFAVLRPQGIEPLVLAALLRSDFANHQLMRHNMGVSYPAIDEDCVLDVVLPMRSASVAGAEHAAQRMLNALAEYEASRTALDRAIENVIAEVT